MDYVQNFRINKRYIDELTFTQEIGNDCMMGLLNIEMRIHLY